VKFDKERQFKIPTLCCPRFDFAETVNGSLPPAAEKFEVNRLGRLRLSCEQTFMRTYTYILKIFLSHSPNDVSGKVKSAIKKQHISSDVKVLVQCRV